MKFCGASLNFVNTTFSMYLQMKDNIKMYNSHERVHKIKFQCVLKPNDFVVR